MALPGKVIVIPPDERLLALEAHPNVVGILDVYSWEESK